MNITQKKSQSAQLELLFHHIKFYPDQIKSVRENEANRFALYLACDSQERSR